MALGIKAFLRFARRPSPPTRDTVGLRVWAVGRISARPQSFFHRSKTPAVGGLSYRRDREGQKYLSVQQMPLGTGLLPPHQECPPDHDTKGVL